MGNKKTIEIVDKCFKGYARCNEVIGDIIEISDTYVKIQPFKTNNLKSPVKIFIKFKIGKSPIEIIEFGSFNPKMYNYTNDGKVIKII